MKRKPLVSVVVPVYGTEKYLRKCLDSILNQTYENIELIIVNDASKDDSENIIKEYLQNYDNIKYVKHSRNRGLFRARISGAEEATGEYIAFVDSDDYISFDFYRLLVNKAMETQSDMTISDFILEHEDGKREYLNMDSLRIQELNLEGNKIIDAFMQQQGLCFSWQLMWNKLYKKSLWNLGYEKFKKFSDENDGLIMTEDIAFSSFFWTHAKKVVNVPNATYFYCKHTGQSVDAASLSKEKLKTNINHTVASFGFLKDMLVETNYYTIYEKEYKNWVKLYGRINFENLKSKGMLDEFYQYLKDNFFENEEVCGMSFEDDFFYNIKTEIAPAFKWYEDLKKMIADPECKVVSFDIFDTLILRPFWLPTDLFYTLNDYFIEITGASTDIDFAQMRIESEKSCREKLRVICPSKQDMNINEIYDEMHDRYFISEEVCHKMKEKEIEAEIRFCRERNTGKELYKLALDLGKTVVFTSDMYLTMEVIEKILHKNGYDKYDKIFLSSDVRFGKWSGDLFKYLLNDLEIKNPQSVVHIGDNWQSDVEMPKKFNIKSGHIEKTINVFANWHNGIYAGESFAHSFIHNSSGRNLNAGMWGFFGLRTMLAVVANKMFDNPHVSFNKQTDFNAAPSYIGYYAVGMHLFAVVKWLIEKIKNKDVNTVHFVARDGYMVKKIYDIINKDNHLPKSNYLYLSRKALTLADVKEPVDIYSFVNKINILKTSPYNFVCIFKDVISDDEINQFINDIQDTGLVKDNNFKSRQEYERFVKIFIDKLWDKINWKNYKKTLRDYFGKIIDKNDVFFDIGYSGRAESALKILLGYTVDSYYIHTNSDAVNRRGKAHGFNNETFYNYAPNITGVMREHIFMKLSPSAVGYERDEKGKISPVFEKYEIDYPTEFITTVVQDSAVSFVKDLIEIFGDDIDKLYARREDASQPFEYYLHYGKKLDRNIFASLVFEDDFGEGKRLRAVDFWSEEIERTMNNRKNIDFENRVISKEEYIGTSKPAKYIQPIRSKNKEQTNFKKVAFFNDKINENDVEISDKFIKCSNNTSNIVDWKAIEKLINPILIDNWYMTNPGGFADGEFDVFLTSNLSWIQENTDITYLDRVLERIGNSVLLPINIGFTTDIEKTDFVLDEGSVNTLKKIAERCKSIGVKGEYTAEILSKYGIKNSVIVGCPSMYTNILEMKKINSTKIEIETGVASFKPFYGELSEAEIYLLKFFEKNKFNLVETTNLDMSESNIKDEKMYSYLKAYEKTKKIYFDINSWRDSFKVVDFAMGMNFYNNVVALQSGVPALFVCYETTGREMCKFFNLPNIDINEINSKKTVSDYRKIVDYSSFLSSIDQKYDIFRKFLSENGVKINRVVEK